MKYGVCSLYGQIDHDMIHRTTLHVTWTRFHTNTCCLARCTSVRFEKGPLESVHNVKTTTRPPFFAVRDDEGSDRKEHGASRMKKKIQYILTINKKKTVFATINKKESGKADPCCFNEHWEAFISLTAATAGTDSRVNRRPKRRSQVPMK